MRCAASCSGVAEGPDEKERRIAGREAKRRLSASPRGNDTDGADRAAGERRMRAISGIGLTTPGSPGRAARGPIPYACPSRPASRLLHVPLRCCWLRRVSRRRRAEGRPSSLPLARTSEHQPLFTLHPLARQVERYVLLTTLSRYDER